MRVCPQCGRELAPADETCPGCQKKIQPPFTIRNFILDNFRLFTIIGTSGTMISLIPTMGNRILGTTWITNTDGFLPMILSIIIFFGACFLTLCFLMVLGQVFHGRKNEPVRNRFFGSTITLHQGDTRRFILLFCLIPMWFGILIFFLMLMPLIPNRYSWLFATVAVLTCVPLVIYSLLGWTLGKKITRAFPGLAKYPRASAVVFAVIVIGVLLLLLLALPAIFDNDSDFSSHIKIRPDQQYYSPQVSSAKGLHLTITNLSGRELLSSRHEWSADFGYFIRVVPSTAEVTILGNPVTDDNARDIYWTYSTTDPAQNKTPVTIDLHLYSSQDNREVASPSLYLTWYTNDIVAVNASAWSGE
jgi:NADH:ubiquinone oxidoreductase subunit 3 (subunit A)